MEWFEEYKLSNWHQFRRLHSAMVGHWIIWRVHNSLNSPFNSPLHLPLPNMVSQGSEVELKSVENNNLVEDTSTTTIYEKARQSKNYFFFTNLSNIKKIFLLFYLMFVVFHEYDNRGLVSSLKEVEWMLLFNDNWFICSTAE